MNVYVLILCLAASGACGHAEVFQRAAKETLANLFRIHGWMPESLEGTRRFTRDSGVFRIDLQGHSGNSGKLLKKLSHELADIAVSDVTSAWYSKQDGTVKRAFRTSLLARGDTPYAVIIDDIELATESKSKHYFEWLMPCAPELKFQKLTAWMNPDLRRHYPDLYNPTYGEVILADTSSKPHAILFAKVVHLPNDHDRDERMLPSVRFEQGASPDGAPSLNRVAFVARGRKPRFIIVLAPKVITATWARGKDKLTVAAGLYTDEFTFRRAKDGTTSIRMDQRDAGSPAIKQTAVFSTGSEDIEMLVDEDIKD